MAKINPEALIEGFNEQLRSEWQQHRSQAFNANTKGATYEKTLKGFLQDYFSEIYNIRTRTAVVDRKLKCFDTFDAGESELDVVASFKQAVPGIILESGDMKWVPYDGVAFICEVKSKLTTSALESDIEKLAKLNELGRDNMYRRFDYQKSGLTKLSWGGEEGKKHSTKVSTDHQLKCLVYDEASISGESLMEKLEMFTGVWDLVLIVEEEVVIISPELPFVDAWYQRTNIDGIDDESELFPDVLVLPEGILWFILLISVSIPRPIPFDATQALIQLVQREWTDESGKYNQMVGAWDQLF